MRMRAVVAACAISAAGCSLLYGPGDELSAGGGVVPSEAGLDALDSAVDGAGSNGGDAGADAPAPLPAIPAGGLVVWLRADDGLVVASEEHVSAWKDSTPKLRPEATAMDALQATSSAQPLRTAGPNGLPAVAFDGAQLLELPFGFQDFSDGLTIFVAMVLPPASAGGPVFALGLYGNGCARGGELASEHDGFGYRVENTALSTADGIASSWEILGVIQAPVVPGGDAGGSCPTSNVELLRSGLVAQSGEVQLPAKGARSGTSVGRSNYYPSTFLRGVVGEILVYQRALDAAERATISTYLTKKWHP